MEAIITALISAGAAIAVCIINSNVNHRKLLAELEKRDELQAYRIEQLEKKVDKHNQIVERTYRLEEGFALHEEKLKVTNHRITDLEGYHK